ncbi:uncharacterized protein LOC110015203 isoform X1 [Oryzias latipes]|uniref:uncharacterized protein LOC110015203 isoform X1 n=1 Tax=Oryzias latipes TaxID=8090 RepID=UPI000CE23366|nr:uncharacterized protein LOC110015203 isoform X1 [Oryzias latipes]
MPFLELMIIFMLQFKGISGETLHLFARAGDQVLLPYCANSSSQSFSEVNCLYQKDKSTSGNVVIRGDVVQSSAGASRLSVSRNSLLMRNISAEDAGLYVCIQPQCPAFIYLSILSISPSPPDLHGNVKLHCSLISIDDQVSCQRSSILWENETGNELIGEKAELEVGGRRNCDSVLTVKHTTENNRRFTCKFVKNKEVKIDAVYVAAFTDRNHSSTSIITGAMVSVVLMLLAVITAVLFKRRKAKVTGDQKSEADLQKLTYRNSDLTYATVIHLSPKTFPKTTVNKEEAEVTYSAVRVK